MKVTLEVILRIDGSWVIRIFVNQRLGRLGHLNPLIALRGSIEYVKEFAGIFRVSTELHCHTVLIDCSLFVTVVKGQFIIFTLARI